MNPYVIILIFLFLIIMNVGNSDELNTTDEDEESTNDSVASKLGFSCNDLFEDLERFICKDDDVNVKNMR